MWKGAEKGQKLWSNWGDVLALDSFQPLISLVFRFLQAKNPTADMGRSQTCFTMI
jgi:hypothetical protein